MEQQVIDRRTDSRFPPPDANAARATLRPGCVVALVDVSRGGALVEGPGRCDPAPRRILPATLCPTRSSMTSSICRFRRSTDVDANGPVIGDPLGPRQNACVLKLPNLESCIRRH